MADYLVHPIIKAYVEAKLQFEGASKKKFQNC